MTEDVTRTALTRDAILLTGKVAVATGGGRVLPERAGVWEVTSGWRDEDGQWRLYYAEWKRR